MAPAPYDSRVPPVVSLEFSADGSLLASTLRNGLINILNTKTSAVLATWEGEALSYGTRPITFSPDSTLLAFRRPGDYITLFDVHARAASVMMRGPLTSINDLAFSPNCRIIAAASGDDVRLWIVETRAELRILYGRSRTVHAVTYSPTNDLLASRSYDNTIRLWHVDSGGECGSLWDHFFCSPSISFSPDGKLLGSATDYSVIRI